jgi:hypothetical protein
VAARLAAKAITLKRVAQEGMRVRASAGAASCRRRGALEQHWEDAREPVETLKQQSDADPAALTRSPQAARTRAAREREAKVQKALARWPEREAIQVRQGKQPATARASTTDDQAMVMTMADGGYRPADNAQFATDTESQVMVGVAVVTTGSDRAPREPMVEQVTARYGQTPEEGRVDGGFPAHAPLDAVAGHTTVYAPAPQSQDPATDPPAPKPKDRPAVAEWRARRGTDEAKAIDKDRAATAECVNALARHRGLNQCRVRGPAKVRGVLLGHALTHHRLRTFALAPEWLGLGIAAPDAVATAA